MTDLVVGVIRDVLRHVPVQVRQCRHIRGGPPVLTTELVVLLPQVAFDQLGRREEPQDRNVTPRKSAAASHRCGRKQGAARNRRRTGQTDAPQERAPPDDPPPLCLNVVALELWLLWFSWTGERKARLVRVI